LWLADLVLVIHFALVLFVVLGLALIWIGRFRGWRWVRQFWFRLFHVSAMGVVAAKSLCGVECPLTTWEDQLRAAAGTEGRYAGSFIQHWLHRVMFFEANEAIFTVIYVVFFAAVLLSLWLVAPRWPWGNRVPAAWRPPSHP
jgi:hypothetical protein